MKREASKREPVHPTEFFFELHPMPGLPRNVEWMDDHLEIRSEGHTVDFVRSPTPQSWEEFWQDVDASGVWEWEVSYVEPGILDGLGWTLRLEKEGRQIVSQGMNAYPGIVRRIGEPTKEFRQYAEAVDRLIGNTHLFGF
jgi:hypothetical protein